MVTLNNSLSLLMIRELKNIQNTHFLWYLLLLLGDINLHPGPSQILPNISNIWDPFDHRGLHLLHLNVNSLLNKIDELRYISKVSNAAVIGITETKLDNSVNDSEISIAGYKVIRNDRNRHGGGCLLYQREYMFQHKRCFF